MIKSMTAYGRGEAEGPDLLDPLPGLVHPAGGLALDDRGQGRARPVHERQEQVELAAAEERRQLDARDDLDPGPAPQLDGVRVGGHGVVVGHAERRDAGPRGAIDTSARRKSSGGVRRTISLRFSRSRSTEG